MFPQKTPKVEIVENFINVWVDDSSTIEKELQKFGYTKKYDTGFYRVYISKQFDIEEVKSYIENHILKTEHPIYVIEKYKQTIEFVAYSFTFDNSNTARFYDVNHKLIGTFTNVRDVYRKEYYV